MTYAEARLRLANHSNLSSDLPKEESFIWSLYNATKTGIQPDIEALVRDVIACLEVVNRKINSAIPSESSKRIDERSGTIHDVAYSVSGIVTSGISYLRQWSREQRFSIEARDRLLEAIHRIAFAWDQVLAGDINDLLEGFQ